MKSALQNNDPEHKVLIEKIDLLSSEYQTHRIAVEEIKKIEDPEEKTNALKKFVSVIEEREKQDDTKKLISDVKEKLPDVTKHEASRFIDRAKTFYDNNKKIIQFAALMTLTVIGIALTVTTGGIAGALGAAVLGSVAFKSGKSLTNHFKNMFTDDASTHAHAEKKHAMHPGEATLVTALLNDLTDVSIEHCERQEKSAHLIATSLNRRDYPDAKGELEHSTQKFKESAAALEELSDNHKMTLQEKTKEIAAISEFIHETNKAAILAIREVGDNLSPELKTEAEKFIIRAKNFYEDNKKIVHSVGKVILAVSTLVVLGAATGGVGVVIAAGFSATSWLIKKAAEKIIAIKQKNAAHEDEHEDQGKRNDEKGDPVKTQGLGEHH